MCTHEDSSFDSFIIFVLQVIRHRLQLSPQQLSGGDEEGSEGGCEGGACQYRFGL